MIKYIGSKRTLVPLIGEIVERLPDVRSACDLFTGTTRVAQRMQAAGFEVTANDLATYSEVLARCYIEADAALVDVAAIEEQLAWLGSLPGVDGYVTETFCRRSRYFQEHNGRRIDAIRAGIDEIAPGGVERAILLTSLLEAADRVDSTVGLQMAYLKGWSARSHKQLELRLPRLTPGSGTVHRSEAVELAARLAGIDLVYLDPPYNQHSYHSNYHVWETIVRGDEPETYGIACKRVDCREVKSDFNSKRRAWDAFEVLVTSLDAPWLLVSMSDDGGYVPPARIRELLEARGDVASVPVDFARYVGARIGIHDPSGRVVGKVGRLRTTEHLILCGPGAPELMQSLSADLVGAPA